MEDVEQTHVQSTEIDRVYCSTVYIYIHCTKHHSITNDFLRLSKDVQDLKALDVDAECSGATNLDSLQGEIFELLY